MPDPEGRWRSEIPAPATAQHGSALERILSGRQWHNGIVHDAHFATGAARGSKAGCSSARQGCLAGRPCAGSSRTNLLRGGCGGSRKRAHAVPARPSRKIRPCSIGRRDRSESRGDVREFSAFRFLMVVAVADTHATLWYLFSDPRLGRAASAFIDAAVADGNHIGVSAIGVAEMVCLIEKGRIPATALADVQARSPTRRRSSSTCR